MEDGRWKMEDGRWKMADGRWKALNEKRGTLIAPAGFAVSLPGGLPGSSVDEKLSELKRRRATPDFAGPDSR